MLIYDDGVAVHDDDREHGDVVEVVGCPSAPGVSMLHANHLHLRGDDRNVHDEIGDAVRIPVDQTVMEAPVGARLSHVGQQSNRSLATVVARPRLCPGDCTTPTQLPWLFARPEAYTSMSERCHLHLSRLEPPTCSLRPCSMALARSPAHRRQLLELSTIHLVACSGHTARVLQAHELASTIAVGP